MSEKIGCLVIHGFGGCTREVNPLKESLEQDGYIVNCPSLKGHTGRRRDLWGVRYTDWIASAEKGLLELKARCESIYIIGFSMGGLIAINLASKYEVDGIVTLSTPIFYFDTKRILMNISEDIHMRSYNNIRRYIAASKSIPISAMFNFNVILRRTKPKLQNIRCPIFIVQGLEDDTVKRISASFIYRNVSSKDKGIKFYKDSGHLILWSSASNEVIDDVRRFLKSHIR